MRLGWVDFSREAQKKAFDALAALSERGAVDELGFGTLRDAFADAFFPGTSTLQTRAKYFVLVPCAIRYALENGKDLRKVERECCRRMWDNCGRSRQAGVIGNQGLNNGSEWIQRPPSEIYWAGMRKLGILRSPLSPGLWFAHARRLVAESGGEMLGQEWQEGESDDRETCFSGWKRDFAFPWKTLYADFLKKRAAQELSPDLTPGEAAFLRQCIVEADETRGTLFACCLASPARIPRAEDGADEDEAPSTESRSPFFRFARSVRRHVPADIGTLLDAANALNRLVLPARVLHNRLLGAAPEAADIWDDIQDEVPGWAEAVDPTALWGLFPGRIPGQLAVFLHKLRESFRKKDFPTAERLVRQREIDLKGSRAKVLHPEKLPSGKWVGGGWLDYRLSIAGRILRDIAETGSAPDA